MTLRVGLATIVAGRRDHLARQARAVRRIGGVARHVVVAMDAAAVDVGGCRVLRVPAAAGGLPLARARNRAIAALGDCDLAVLLDVDCIPGRSLVARYVEAAVSLAPARALLCGPVGYLADRPGAAAGAAGDPTAAERSAARRRVIRDFPVGGVRREPRAELFWSLSFAVAPVLHRELGGFDEGFVGYGAEDTDYGLRAAAAAVGLWFVGGAWAYHQHHPPSPPGRVREVAANAQRFHDRWGEWPMPDVLAELAAARRIRWSPAGDRCTVIEAGPVAGRALAEPAGAVSAPAARRPPASAHRPTAGPGR